MTGSSLDFRWATVQEGVMRRSEEEAVEVMMMGTSRQVVRLSGIVALRSGEIRRGSGRRDYKATTVFPGWFP